MEIRLFITLGILVFSHYVYSTVKHQWYSLHRSRYFSTLDEYTSLVWEAFQYQYQKTQPQNSESVVRILDFFNQKTPAVQKHLDECVLVFEEWNQVVSFKNYFNWNIGQFVINKELYQKVLNKEIPNFNYLSIDQSQPNIDEEVRF